jgi:hypothetical protein
MLVFIIDKLVLPVFNKDCISNNRIQVYGSMKQMIRVVIYLEKMVQKVYFTLCSLHMNFEHL